MPLSARGKSQNGWDEAATQFENLLTTVLQADDSPKTCESSAGRGKGALLSEVDATSGAQNQSQAKTPKHHLPQHLQVEPRHLTILSKIVELSEAKDWQGLAALECEAMAVAADLQSKNL